MDYLARLKTLDAQTSPPFPPSKPSKPSFEGFEGDPPACVSQDNPIAEAAFDVLERTAIVWEGAGLPIEWAEGFARQEALPSPPGVSPARWVEMMDAARRFLDQWGANRTNLAEAAAKGAEANGSGAFVFAANVLPIVKQLQAGGITSHRGLAEGLNARGVRTARGGKWHATTVRNLLARDKR